MNSDMPWVDLTQEEVEELRKSKKELTEYGKEKLRKLMKVTEHNVDADWKSSEIDALMVLVKGEMIKEDNDKFTKMFYAKIYGKLMGMKHDLL